MLKGYLLATGRPVDPTQIRRQDIEAFLADLAERISPRSGRPMTGYTTRNRYRSLHVFFEWLLSREEIEKSPMDGMQLPSVKKSPPDVMTLEQLDKLMAACAGKDFHSRRDTAIFTLLIDTGLRRQELASIVLNDIDWQTQTISVLGKGEKVRRVPFGDHSAMVLRSYIRARRTMPLGGSEALWIGREGPLKGDAIFRVLQRRAQQAGIEHVWVHLFRHSWAHYFLDDDGEERDLKVMGGWDSDEMVRWYGKGQETNRAIKAGRKHSPADRLFGDKKRKK
jgi:site-specific recombinase XerD